MQSSKNTISGSSWNVCLRSMKEVKMVASVNLYPKEPTLVMPRSDKKSCSLNMSLRSWGSVSPMVLFSLPSLYFCCFCVRRELPKIFYNFSWGWGWIKRSSLWQDVLWSLGIRLLASWRDRLPMGFQEIIWLLINHRARKVLIFFWAAFPSCQEEEEDLRRSRLSRCPFELRCSQLRILYIWFDAAIEHAWRDSYDKRYRRCNVLFERWG